MSLRLAVMTGAFIAVLSAFGFSTAGEASLTASHLRVARGWARDAIAAVSTAVAGRSRAAGKP